MAMVVVIAEPPAVADPLEAVLQQYHPLRFVVTICSKVYL